jgi:hypothetical protein
LLLLAIPPTSYPLQVQEAMLTGESVPISKNTAAVPADVGLGDRKCLAYSATAVSAGQGLGVVVATGKAAAAAAAATATTCLVCKRQQPVSLHVQTTEGNVPVGICELLPTHTCMQPTRATDISTLFSQ